jgi:hypothetical protein
MFQISFHPLSWKIAQSAAGAGFYQRLNVTNVIRRTANWGDTMLFGREQFAGTYGVGQFLRTFHPPVAPAGTSCLCRQRELGLESGCERGTGRLHGSPRSSAGSYTTSIDVGNTVSYTVTNLVEGATYHFGRDCV